MRIALFSAFYPYRGGIAQFSAQLYRSLEKEHEVKAFTFKRQYPGILFPGKTQFVTEDDEADPIVAERILDMVNVVSPANAAKKIRTYEPDLVISQYWMTFFGPAIGAMHKRLSKTTKRISIVHNMIPHERKFYDKLANRIFLKHNDGFVVLSDAVLQDLLLLKPDAKYLRIDHPVYNQFGDKVERGKALSELNLNPEFNYLLFFGFIRDYKGLDLLLEAMRDLPEEYHLIIAGEVYGSFDKYKKIIDSAGLGDRIHLFNQYIGDKQVKYFFSAADVCVLPYRSATQSGITAIAQHFELPVIATDVGGLKENVLHEENGLIVSAPHPHLIGNAIKHYFNGELRSKFEAKILASKEKNSWKNFSDRIVEFAETL